MKVKDRLYDFGFWLITKIPQGVSEGHARHLAMHWVRTRKQAVRKRLWILWFIPLLMIAIFALVLICGLGGR